MRVPVVGDADDGDLDRCQFEGHNDGTQVYLGLLDQGVESAHASSISSGHAVDLVHDQATPVRDCHPVSVDGLLNDVRHIEGEELWTYALPLVPLVNSGIVDVHAVLSTNQYRCQTLMEQLHTSTNFLLLASLALSSTGVKPANFAHKCALVVFPIPGDPVIKTAR